jgi:hypothetical protein
MSRSPSTLLALALSISTAALAAACGEPPAPVTPENPAAVPPTSATGPTPETAPPASATPAAVKPPGLPGGTPVQASKLLADVMKAGIDPAKAPSLEKMASAEKKKLMPFFVKALGYKDCTGCHASLSDYKTVTHNMQLTRGMWDHFIAYARDTDDKPLFCDSCHAGSPKILRREDHDAVKKFMESDYVGKLHRADKKAMECTTCHGDAMEMDIFGKLWAVK